MTQFITQSGNPALISALAALFGSLIGALGSSVGAWIAQRHQNRKDLLAKKIFHREQLYSDFIRETALAIVDAIQHKLHDASKLIPSYALISRIRLSSSSDVIQSAERVMRSVLTTYSEPNLTNLTPEELQAWIARSNDPLREFSNICRRELDSLWGEI